MTGPQVSDEAVEAAIMAATQEDNWVTEDDIRRAFRAALAAAAPHIVADALDARPLSAALAAENEIRKDERERIATAIAELAAPMNWDKKRVEDWWHGRDAAARIARAGGTP